MSNTSYLNQYLWYKTSLTQLLTTWLGKLALPITQHLSTISFWLKAIAWNELQSSLSSNEASAVHFCLQLSRPGACSVYPPFLLLKSRLVKSTKVYLVCASSFSPLPNSRFSSTDSHTLAAGQDIINPTWLPCKLAKWRTIGKYQHLMTFYSQLEWITHCHTLRWLPPTLSNLLCFCPVISVFTNYTKRY